MTVVLRPNVRDDIAGDNQQANDHDDSREALLETLPRLIPVPRPIQLSLDDLRPLRHVPANTEQPHERFERFRQNYSTEKAPDCICCLSFPRHNRLTAPTNSHIKSQHTVQQLQVLKTQDMLVIVNSYNQDKSNVFKLPSVLAN